jgi:hypothetical protein
VTTLADSPEDARSVLGTMWGIRRFEEAVRALASCGAVGIVGVSIVLAHDTSRTAGCRMVAHRDPPTRLGFPQQAGTRQPVLCPQVADRTT